MKHRYRVTLEDITPGRGEAGASLCFEASCHDDVFAIVEKITTRPEFTDAEEAAAFAVGLKLFSEVMLKHRDTDLFSGFVPHFGNFMKNLKKGLAPKKPE